METTQQALSGADFTDRAAQEWRSYIDPLAAIGEKMVPRLTDAHEPRLRRELYSAMFSQLATAYLGLLNADPKHPDFWPWFNNAFNNLGPNPDNVFSLTPVDDNGVYKLSGFRGTVRIVDFQLGTGSFIPCGTFDDPVYSITKANYDIDTLPIGDDGAFEVVLSAKRPQGHEGSWWELPAGVTYLFVRQVSYDWLHEVDARLAIERLDTPAVKPRPSAEVLEAKLKGMATWLETNMQFTFDFIDDVRKVRGANNIDWVDFGEFGGLTTQKYMNGTFDLAPDEAMIIEVDVPQQCRYWSLHLINDLFLSLDWMNRQTSVNGFTAQADPDAKCRIVISAQDPGTPNWLDTAGYRSGGIQGRWKECSSWPAHKAIKVKVAAVRKHLPADTPVVTLEQREAAIRLRRKAVQMRRRW